MAENGNGNGWKGVLATIIALAALVGADHIILMQRIDGEASICSQRANGMDMARAAAWSDQYKRGDSMDAQVHENRNDITGLQQKLNEVETQFSQEARVRYTEINGLREVLHLPGLTWMGDGTRSNP